VPPATILACYRRFEIAAQAVYRQPPATLVGGLLETLSGSA